MLLVTDTVPIVGACGTVEGVNEEEADVAVELPFALFATAVKVYDVPDVRPGTVTGDVPVALKEPGEDVTVNPETVFPPVALAVTGTEAETVAPNAAPITFVGVPIVGV